MAGMGATFYPGNDDYYMPEVAIVSPAPQRFVFSNSCLFLPFPRIFFFF
jgi:hypothetical protein